eukprot:TRINITY_DN12825_c0_g1_i1.p1 TRINITY_DN12825_c0_g1~~TRINITY_DN12825_c0_g1_i1.p1  ORF type:complete len:426 (+),score=50.71 TRINITY_DN12825_c0_g1_i1:80-1279(+)
MENQERTSDKKAESPAPPAAKSAKPRLAPHHFLNQIKNIVRHSEETDEKRRFDQQTPLSTSPSSNLTTSSSGSSTDQPTNKPKSKTPDTKREKSSGGGRQSFDGGEIPRQRGQRRFARGHSNADEEEVWSHDGWEEFERPQKTNRNKGKNQSEVVADDSAQLQHQPKPSQRQPKQQQTKQSLLEQPQTEQPPAQNGNQPNQQQPKDQPVNNTLSPQKPKPTDQEQAQRKQNQAKYQNQKQRPVVQQQGDPSVDAEKETSFRRNQNDRRPPRQNESDAQQPQQNTRPKFPRNQEGQSPNASPREQTSKNGSPGKTQKARTDSAGARGSPRNREIQKAPTEPLVLLVVNIEVSSGRTEVLKVCEGEDPRKLVHEFCQRFGMEEASEKLIASQVVGALEPST